MARVQGSGGSGLRRLGVTQLVALGLWAARALLAELGGRIGDLVVDAGRRRSRRHERAVRAAERLADVLGRLKGAFAKLGQFASLRVDLLSPAVRERFAGLRDRVPPLPFSVVRGVVEAELGAPLEARFERFETEPLGAASIAQAHRAWLPGGRGVVVKVQYPWLARSLRADLTLLRALFAASAWARPGTRVDRRRLFAEFAAGLGEELDFLREAAVAEEVARNLAGEAGVVVPAVVRSHTTRRVLVVEHHAAVPIGDRPALLRLGVEPRDVLEILTRAYAKQVFVDGLFHADPHPGNLFVVDEPEARRRARVLFVDFGLSKRLAPALRRELRLGIQALLVGDLPGFLAGMQRIGAVAPGAQPKVAEAVRSMFEEIRADAAGPLALSGPRVLALKDEAKRLLLETEGLQLPGDLLLYAKTVSYLFGLGSELAPQVDLMRLCVPYLLRFLAEREGPSAGAAAGPAPG